jgi:hypothetical protein
LQLRALAPIALTSLLGACITPVESKQMVAAAVPFAGGLHTKVGVEVTGPDPDEYPVEAHWSSENYAQALVAWLDASMNFSVEAPEEFLIAVNVLRVEKPTTALGPTIGFDADWRLYSPDREKLYFQTYVSTVNAEAADAVFGLDSQLKGIIAEIARKNMYVSMERILNHLYRQRANLPPKKPTVALRLERGTDVKVSDYWFRVLEAMIASGLADSSRFSDVYARSIQPNAQADYELTIEITGMREVSAARRAAFGAIVPVASGFAGRASIEMACELTDLKAGIVERVAKSLGASDFGFYAVYKDAGHDTTDSAARQVVPDLLLQCAGVKPTMRAP